MVICRAMICIKKSFQNTDQGLTARAIFMDTPVEVHILSNEIIKI
jgi:hypothetical protein